MVLTATTLDDARKIWETQTGYFATPSHSDYHHRDPCKNFFIGGPLSARAETDKPGENSSSSSSSKLAQTTKTPPTDISTTATVKETSTHKQSSQPRPPPTSSPSPTISPPSSTGPPPTTTIASTTPTPTDSGASDSNGVMTLSISALVGIVVSCVIVFLFAALSAYMWWRRYRRDKAKKDQEEQVQRGVFRWESRGAGQRQDEEDQFPSGMDSVFDPMAQAGPGSVFDRAQGRMGSVDVMLNSRPPTSSHDPISPASGAPASSSSNSPLAITVHPQTFSLPTSPVELDSVPVDNQRDMDVAGAAPTHPANNNKTTTKPETNSRRSWVGEGSLVPRATLNATEREMEAGMYANSWSRFQGVQL
ncbi:hypothetical protein VTJ49DRAFT_2884 [Mycothermus thermophilus]|uniref:Uncharacterized protein n=1 Tax=Humicola insolens TaxID=85995 RepID=A0ABR3V657_HUMIN